MINLIAGSHTNIDRSWNLTCEIDGDICSDWEIGRAQGREGENRMGRWMEVEKRSEHLPIILMAEGIATNWRTKGLSGHVFVSCSKFSTFAKKHPRKVQYNFSKWLGFSAKLTWIHALWKYNPRKIKCNFQKPVGFSAKYNFKLFLNMNKPHMLNKTKISQQKDFYKS